MGALGLFLHRALTVPDGLAAHGRGFALLLDTHRECLDLEFCVAPDGVHCILFLVFLVGPEVVCGFGCVCRHAGEQALHNNVYHIVARLYVFFHGY